MMVKPTRKNVEGRVFRTVWPDMKQGDVGEPVEIPSVTHMSIQVVGDSYGSNVVFEGSLEKVPTEWFELWSHDGATYDAMVVWLRPRVVGGNDKSKVEVVLLTRSNG